MAIKELREKGRDAETKMERGRQTEERQTEIDTEMKR